MSSHLLKMVSRKIALTDAAVEEVSRNEEKTLKDKLDRSTNYQEAIEGPGTFLIDPPVIEDLSRL